MKRPSGILIFLAFALWGRGQAEDIQYRWNLNDLYSSAAAWDADATQLEREIAALQDCQGHLGESASRLKACLELSFAATKRFNRLFVFALLRRDEDTSDASGTESFEKAGVLQSHLDQAAAFLRPELLAVGEERVQTLLNADPSLALYRHYLENVQRAKTHTLSEEGESVIASFGLVDDAAESSYRIFTNAEMPRTTINLSDGSQAHLDDSGYEKYRQVGNREDRKRVFDGFWGVQKQFEGTLGTMLYKSMQKDLVNARVRHYPDSLSAKMDDDKIPLAVYETMIEQANLGLPTLHRYFRLRARLLGLAKLRYYDIYVPLVHSDQKYSPERAQALTLEAVEPLGRDYVQEMRAAFSKRWVDFYSRPHKASGGYMAGLAYDVHPYLLLNHDDTYQSLATFAHEFGHALHTRLTDSAQPFIYSRYPIFLAEIASTCNEQLLLEHLLRVSTSDDERIFYLGSALENMRATFFRQAMFAEFERNAHAMVDRGEPLSGAAFTELYGDLLKRYHGDSQGVVKIDDLYTVEWSFIPHFYDSFYVYQYVTAVAASSLFADAIVQKKTGAQSRYMQLLRAGSSDYPYDLVKNAGVDLASPAPYQSLIARMNHIMDQIEALDATKKSQRK